MTESDPPKDALEVVRRDLTDAHADLQQVQSVVLREGPRAKKTARYVAVRNRHTGEVHHHALTLETGKKRQGTWELDDKRSVSFSDEEGDEIGRLMDFLKAVRPETPAGATASGDPLEALAGLQGDVEGLKRLVKRVRERPDDFRAVGAALTFGRYAQALERLKKLLAAEAPVEALRRLLEEHPWLTGGEHAEAVPADELDGAAVLRRSPAGRLEAWMAGPAADGPLFEGDAPGPALARALGEALRLLALIAPAGAVTLTLVTGRAGDEAEHEALGRLNAQLRDVEVLTYDELQHRAERVIDVLRRTARGDG